MTPDYSTDDDDLYNDDWFRKAILMLAGMPTEFHLLEGNEQGMPYVKHEFDPPIELKNGESFTITWEFPLG